MNERYVAEPSAFENCDELKNLLERMFGPYAGRYLAEYPDDWCKRVIAHCKNWRVTDTARVSVLLRRAQEQLAVVRDGRLPWDDSRNWITNAAALTQPAALVDGVLVARANQDRFPTLDDLELPLTADEHLAGTAKEYARASRTLLLESSELAFIDPYLNPCKQDVSAVLLEMFRVLAQGRCSRVVCWAREQEIVKARSVKQVLERLRQIRVGAGYTSEKRLEFNVVDDKWSDSKMHARYLLSKYGAIRFDRGFQEQARKRAVEVSVVGKASHDEIYGMYFEGRHDMKISEAHSVIVT